MFYAFLNAVAKNTQQNNLQTGQAISTMATTLDSLTSHIRDLPTQLASMSLSSQQMANRYAKQPTLPFPKFSFVKNGILLQRFVDTTYLRWIYENKLDPIDDSFRYLHRIFAVKKRSESDATYVGEPVTMNDALK